MKTRYLSIMVLGVLLTLTACQEGPPKPWVPVLEQVDYVPLHDVALEAQRHLDRARQTVQDETSARELEQARQALYKLEYYFLPMTEVRQLVYDADRVYFLDRKAAALEKLHGAAALLEKIGVAGGKGVEEAVGQVVEMIDDLERSIGSEPLQVASKMRTLGEKVNLMLLKGELIVAGATYTPTP